MLYGHLENPSTLEPGDLVSPGETIGVMGNTGRSQGTYLHFEARSGKDGSLEPGEMCSQYACGAMRNYWNLNRIDPSLLMNYYTNSTNLDRVFNLGGSYAR